MVDIRTAVTFGPAVAGTRAAQQAAAVAFQERFGRRGRASVVFTRATGRTAQQRQFAERKIQLDRARAILKTAETRLLRPTERAELERITAPPPVPTRADISDVLIRGTGLSPLQRAQLAQQRQLESERLNVLRSQTNLDFQRKELESRFKTLQRLSNAGALLPGVATKFNADIKRFEEAQKKLRSTAAITALKIKKFKKPEITRIVGEPKKEKPIGLPKTAQQLFQTGLAREFQREKAIKETIQRPFGLIDVRRTILETEKAGREFGAATFAAGTELFGARTGAVAGRVLGGIEAGARFVVDRPLFEVEKAIGKPLKFEFGGRLARDILIAKRIPVVRELLGVTEAKEVEKGIVQVGRPTLREFGTSLAFFVGPELAVGGLRVAARAARISQVRAGIKLRSFFEIPQKGEFRVPSGIIEAAREKRAFELFGKVPFPEELVLPIKEAQFKKLFAFTPTPEKLRVRAAAIGAPQLEAGLVVLPSGEVKVGRILTRQEKFLRDLKELIEEQAAQFPRGVPRQRTLQLQKGEDFFGGREAFFGRLKPKRIDTDVLGIIESDTRRLFGELRFGIEAVTPKIVTRPRAITGLRGLSVLGAISAARLSLRERELLKAFDITKTFTTTFDVTRQRDFALQAARFFTSTVTTPKAPERTIQRERELLRLRILNPTVTVITDITKPKKPITPKVTKKPRPPPPIVPLLFPEIEAPLEVLPEPKKVQGFFAMVKARPFRKKKFVKVSKALSMEAALQRGLRVADVTIAQSVRLVKSKKKVRRQPVPIIDLRSKFRKKGNIFIEKRRFAIDTITEKQDLSVAKFLAQEKRKGLSFFGVQPRRRKKRSRRKKK